MFHNLTKSTSKIIYKNKINHPKIINQTPIVAETPRKPQKLVKRLYITKGTNINNHFYRYETHISSPFGYSFRHFVSTSSWSDFVSP